MLYLPVLLMEPGGGKSSSNVCLLPVNSALLESARMSALPIGHVAYPVSSETRWRFRFSLLTTVVTTLLIAWGGVVTSIEAGMAFPDWPTSLGSYNLINPVDEWWTFPPYLAEHGHRLMGMLTGLLTVTLAVWTWWADPRSWMRKLGWLAVLLVIVQGVLGGLRVLWVSLDLAVVHACVAQLFFATLVGMTLFTSESWLRAASRPDDTPHAATLRRLTLATVLVLYVQIILGALLRHPGAGIHPLFAGIHVLGACLVVGLAGVTSAVIYKHFWHKRLLRQGTYALLASVGLQFVLGFATYFLLVFESAAAQRSVWQVVLTSAHVVVGALLMAAAVCLGLWTWRPPVDSPATGEPASSAASSSSLQPARP